MNREAETCARVQERLPLYVGDDLESDVLAELREHLDVCGRCAERAEDAAAARTAFQEGLRIAPVGATLWTGVRAGLRKEGVFSGPTGERAPQTGRRRRLAAAVPLAAAAAVLAALLLGPWSGSTGVPGDPETSGPRVAFPVAAPGAGEPLLAEPAGLRKVGWGEDRLLDPAARGTVPFEDRSSGAETGARPVVVPLSPRADGNQLAGYR